MRSVWAVKVNRLSFQTGMVPCKITSAEAAVLSDNETPEISRVGGDRYHVAVSFRTAPQSRSRGLSQFAGAGNLIWAPFPNLSSSHA